MRFVAALTHPRWGPWLLATIWWSTSGLSSIANLAQMLDASEHTISARHLWSTTAVSCALWVPITVGIACVCDRFPLGAANWRRHGIVHGLGCIAVILLRAALIYTLDPVVHWYPSPPTIRGLVLTSVDHNLLVYWTFVGIFHSLASARTHYRRDLAESNLRAELARAELAVLKSQLQPHFMANSLQTVAELIHRDPKVAERVVMGLGELLRQALELQRHDLVPLADELDFVACYLDIERARFGERLQVSWHIEPAAMTLRVPALITQPLVENAIRHGLATASGGTIHIHADIVDGSLHLRVTDERALRESTHARAFGPSAPESRRGQGLHNVRARLAAHFGEQAQLHVDTTDHGTTATLRLPALRHDVPPRSAASSPSLGFPGERRITTAVAPLP